MSAHSPLSAKLAVEAGFDGVWASGFELSALYGLADVSLLTMSQHLEMTRAMVERSGAAVLADLDTGFGNAVNVDYAVRQYAAAGVSAIVIEDKVFPKMTSLAEGARQDLLRIEEFQGKVAAARAALEGQDVLVLARTEALIAGAGEAEALQRAHANEAAGADFIFVHSKSRSPAEIMSFAGAWSGAASIAVVPTSYPSFGRREQAEAPNIRMVIYGNHSLHAAVSGMRSTLAQVYADGDTLGVIVGMVCFPQRGAAVQPSVFAAMLPILSSRRFRSVHLRDRPLGDRPRPVIAQARHAA